MIKLTTVLEAAEDKSPIAEDPGFEYVDEGEVRGLAPGKIERCSPTPDGWAGSLPLDIEVLSEDPEDGDSSEASEDEFEHFPEKQLHLYQLAET